MAVEGHVAVGVQLVEQRLSVLGLLDAQALKALILRIAALLGAETDDVMAVDVLPANDSGKLQSISIAGRMVIGRSPKFFRL